MIHKVFWIFCEKMGTNPHGIVFFWIVCDFFLKLFFFHKSKMPTIWHYKPFHDLIKKRS